MGGFQQRIVLREIQLKQNPLFVPTAKMQGADPHLFAFGHSEGPSHANTQAEDFAIKNISTSFLWWHSRKCYAEQAPVCR